MMRQTLLRTHKRALSTTTVRAQSVAARPALSAPSAAAPFEAPVRGLATEAEEEATPGGMGARFAYTAEVRGWIFGDVAGPCVLLCVL